MYVIASTVDATGRQVNIMMSRQIFQVVPGKEASGTSRYRVRRRAELEAGGLLKYCICMSGFASVENNK